MFEISNLSTIKEDNDYGGYKFKLIATQSNVKVRFSIDVSTGDIITPKAIEYKYKMILEDNYIDILTYNYETIIAEKLETIYSKGFLNSRSKDYFDLYLIWTLLGKEIDKTIMREAVANTFSQRNTSYDPNQIKNLLNQLNTPVFIGRWEAYRRKNNFVGNLSFKEVLKSILELMSILE